MEQRRKLAAKLLTGPVWVVGGTVRDQLLGRPIPDLDLACADAEAAAKTLARAWKAAFVPLDEKNGVYRVVPRDGGQVDVARLQGATIQEDLARRDFTINAMAEPLAGGALIDPRGGQKDLKKRLLRTENENVLREDPLRLLRAFRLAAQLNFSIEAETLTKISKLRQLVRRPAGERLQSEMLQLLAVPGCSRFLKEMDACGLLTALFEELEPSRKCAVDYYGEGGVMTHSLDTASRADFLLSNLDSVFPELAPRLVEAGKQAPLLILAALLHDVSKPETARQVEGRLRFFGHDTLGAKRVEAILKRLRFSADASKLICAAVANHLRPGHLATAPEVTEKAVYRFYRDLGEHALPTLLVCWADHASYIDETTLRKALKTARAPMGEGLGRLKPATTQKTVRHLQLISYLIKRGLDDEKKALPDRVVNGHDVIKAGIKPGPKVGEVLEKVREAQAEGKIKNRKDALAFLKKLADIK
jgi:putative nucleotidyltransferase with HDIG domain